MKIGKSKLTRELLESYAGKDVRITFFDGDTEQGRNARPSPIFEQNRRTK